jgi:tetratricopeptide (TPR) repeat protein
VEEPVRLERGQRLYERGLYQAAVEEWGKALAETDAVEVRARLKNAVAAAYLELGFWREADQATDEALAEAAALPASHPLQPAARFNRSMFLAAVGRFDDAHRLLDELTACLAKTGRRGRFALVEHQKLVLALEKGDFDGIADVSVTELEAFADLGPRHRASLLTNLSIADMFQGRLAEAEAKLWQARGLTSTLMPPRERLAMTSEFARLQLLRGDQQRLGLWLGECGRLVAHDPASVEFLELGRLAVFLGVGLLRSGNHLEGDLLRQKGLAVMGKWGRLYERDLLAAQPTERLGALRTTGRLAFLKRLLIAMPLVDQEPDAAALYVARVGPLLYNGLLVERAAQIAAWADYLPEQAEILNRADKPPEARVAQLIRRYTRELKAGRSYHKALATILTEADLDDRMTERFVTLHVA